MVQFNPNAMGPLEPPINLPEKSQNNAAPKDKPTESQPSVFSKLGRGLGIALGGLGAMAGSKVANSIFGKNTTTYSGTVSHDEYQDGVQVGHYDIPFSGDIPFSVNVDSKFNTTDEKNTTTYSGTVSHDEYQDGVQVAHYDIPFSVDIPFSGNIDGKFNTTD